MKTLKKCFATLLLLMIAGTISSCKKDKQDEKTGESAGSFTYQGSTVKIGTGDYREGNGDGAWIYLTSEDFTDIVQVRFKGLANYGIPTGSFTYKSNGGINPYDPAKNFSGGQVGMDNVYDEFNGGTVKINKDGGQYLIDLDVTTKNGSLKGQFKGTLKKI
uniref:hypothetical protein n=1 Tax=Pedobacter schmidteae TaxID=2201271 RepID=UPI0013CE9078|nr:hypothetical protein [Pedobacter schmidteae]